MSTISPAQRRTLSWLGIAAAAVFLLWLLAPVLTPFLVGAILAYALHPAVERLAARRLPRLLAVLVVEVGAITALLNSEIICKMALSARFHNSHLTRRKA